MLSDADHKGQKAIIFSHFPIYPSNEHNLWDSGDIVKVLDLHKSVFAWFSGHNHSGNYGYRNGVHYVTFNAMVNGNDNSFGIANFYRSKIVVHGNGLQPSLLLRTRQRANLF